MVNLRLEPSGPTNPKTPLPVTAGQTTYISSGIREVLQETIIATRNAEVVQTTVNETTSITDTGVIGSRRIGNSNDDRKDLEQICLLVATQA